MATYLASQDHPEKGLCPHASLKSQGPREVVSEHQDVKDYKIKVKSSSISTPGSSSSCTVHTPQLHKHEQRKWSPDLASQLDGNSEANIQQSSKSLQIVTGSDGKQEQPSEKETKKDPKSFTQSLFDTASMKIFQFASVPDSLCSWNSWLGSREEAAANHLDQSENSTMISGEYRKPGISLIEDVVEDNSQVRSAKRIVQPKTDDKKTATQTALKINAHSSSVISGKSNNHHQANFPSSYDKFSSSRSTELRICKGPNLSGVTSQLAVALDRTESQIRRAASEIPRGLQNLPSESPLPIMKLDKDSAMHAQCKNSGVSSMAELGPIAAPSLSHFSNNNVTGLVLRILNDFPESPDFAHLLNALGQEHSSVNPHAYVTRGTESYQAFISYVRQSISYVLSNTESLLQSFVICRIDDDGDDQIQSTAFVEIVDAFAWLHKFDRRPLNILPSLWSSSGKIYIPGSSRNKTMIASKRRSGVNLGTLDYLNLHLPLNDAEAAHVVEISLAALVASIPECSSETWMIVQQRRACGQLTSLPLPSEVPLRHIITNEIPNVMDSLEDEMALSLMTRLVRAVASRGYTAGMLHHYAVKRSVDRSSSSDFMRLIGNKLTCEFRIDKFATGIQKSPLVKDRRSIERFADETDEWQGGPLKKLYLQQVVEWARGVILREWDGKPEVSRCGAVGGALELMNTLCKYILHPRSITHTNSNLLEMTAAPTYWALPSLGLHFFWKDLMCCRYRWIGGALTSIILPCTCYRTHFCSQRPPRYHTFAQSTTIR